MFRNSIVLYINVLAYWSVGPETIENLFFSLILKIEAFLNSVFKEKPFSDVFCLQTNKEGNINEAIIASFKFFCPISFLTNSANSNNTSAN